jgi:hypothetical protein
MRAWRLAPKDSNPCGSTDERKGRAQFAGLHISVTGIPILEAKQPRAVDREGGSHAPLRRSEPRTPCSQRVTSKPKTIRPWAVF